MSENWGAEEFRQPPTEAGDTVLFSEHGRVLDHVDYRSHWFKLVSGEFGPVSLLVRHGGGDERITEHALRKAVHGLYALDSDDRYLMLYAFYQMYSVGGRKSQEQTAAHYRKAFIDGRMHSRKSKYHVKFWIDPEKSEVIK